MISLDETSLVGMLFFVLLLAVGLGYLCKRIGVPEFIGAIVAGSLVANVSVGSFSLESWLGISFYPGGGGSLNANALAVFFDIGLMFLVFTVGLRIRPGMIRDVGPYALRTASLGALVPFALGAAVIFAVLGDSNVYTTLFIGTALAASSVGIVSHLISTYGLIDRPEGHRLLAAALFEDLGALTLLAVIIALAGTGTRTSTDFFIQALVVVAFVVAFVVVFLFYAERVIRRLARPPSDRSPPSAHAKAAALTIAILVCLGVGYLAETLQLAAILGALFAGMAFAQVSEAYDLERSFGALNTLIVPFFFVYIGLYITVGGLLSVGYVAILITALAIAGKLLAGLAEVRQVGRREALVIGTGLMARGEVAIVIAIAAASTGLLSDSYLGALVVMAIVTTIAGPILFDLVQRTSRARLPPPSSFGGSDATAWGGREG